MSVIGSVAARLLPTLGRWLMPGAAGAVLALGAGFAGGMAFQGWRAGTEIAQTKTALAEATRAHEETLRRNAEAASLALYQAQVRGDALTRQLNDARRLAATRQEELDDALRNATTGDVCLGGDALGVLDGAPGLRVELPRSAGGAAGADARVATDTDIAGWIGRAGGQYEECRRRLDALIEWHANKPPLPRDRD